MFEVFFLSNKDFYYMYFIVSIDTRETNHVIVYFVSFFRFCGANIMTVRVNIIIFSSKVKIQIYCVESIVVYCFRTSEVHV